MPHDARIGLGKGQLGVVDQGAEERPAAIHFGPGTASRRGAAVGQAAAQAVEAGDQVPALRPGKRVGNGAKLIERRPLVAAAGPRADGQRLDGLDRRGAVEIGREGRVFDQPPIGPVAFVRRGAQAGDPLRIGRRLHLRR